LIRHRYRYRHHRRVGDVASCAALTWHLLPSDNFRLIFMNTYHGEVYAQSDKFSIYASQPSNYTTDAGGLHGLLPLAFWTRGLGFTRTSFRPPLVIRFDLNPALSGLVPACPLELPHPARPYASSRCLNVLACSACPLARLHYPSLHHPALDRLFTHFAPLSNLAAT
jgi:hypothetical protein